MSETVSQFVDRAGGGPRILVSCWANGPMLDAVEALLAAVRRQCEAEALFVSTSSDASRQVFADRGLPMLSMQEICIAAGEAGLPERAGEVLDELTEGDRLRGYRPLPADWAPPSAGESDAAYFRWAARRLLSGYAWLFEAISPSVLMTWNGAGGVLNAASAHAAAARGVPTFFLERGLLPRTLVVDPDGVNYGSHVAGDKWSRLDRPEPPAEQLEAAAQYCRRLRESARSVVQHGDALPPADLRRRLNVPADARIVLLPLQIESDTNITRYSPHYKRMPPIIRDVQAALAERSDVVLIVKPHPEDRDRLDELRSLCGPRTRLCADLSLASVLAVAEVVVAVNSTVGLEALVHGKPVVVLGRAIYGEKGFTFDLASPAELPGVLADALAAAAAGQFAERRFAAFLVYLLSRCLFPLSAEDAWGSRRRIASGVAAAARGTV